MARKSPAHLLAFWRLNATWERTHRLAALRPSRPAAPNILSRTKQWPLLFRVGAAVAVLACVGVFVAKPFQETPEITYSTPVGGHKTLALSDGSHIELNTDTVLKVSAHKRRVELVKGEAFFQIKHDSFNPFVVMSNGHRVTDLGTKFRVRSDKNRLEVALLEGSIRFESANPRIPQHTEILTPGDMAVATADSMSVTRKSAQRLSDDSAWRSGMLVFREKTLAEAVAQFNRYNREKLVVDDPRAAMVRIDGSFRTSNLAGFIDMAQHVLSLRVEKRGENIAISR